MTTNPPAPLPGRILDETTGLRAWNDWFVLPGHRATEDMHRAIRSNSKVSLVVLQKPIDDEERQ